MSHLPRTSAQHRGPRSPLVFDTAALSRQPGSARSETRVVPAPADLRVALAGVPAGADVKLDVMLEAVAGGVLVTGHASAPVTGECARCLAPLASSVDVTFRELYEFEPAEPAGDGDQLLIDGDLLDLEPEFRDAVVLALPLAPLCRPECPGLCQECGVPLAQAGPGHGHDAAPDPRWARLRQLDLGRERQNGATAVDGQEG